MIRKTLAVLGGVVAGAIAVMLGVTVSSTVYPPPKGLDLQDAKAMADYIAGLPAGAFLIVLAAHGSGSLIGAAVCTWIAQQRWWLGGVILGLFFLAGGIMNLRAVPHPLWFAIVDIAQYVPLGLAGVYVAGLTLPRQEKD